MSIGNTRGSVGEHRDIAREDAQERRLAERVPNSIILTPQDILSGKWDASKVLVTTIGGVKRPINQNDIRAFKENIKTAQRKLENGVTARQVINMSDNATIKRASEQIRTAVATKANKGKIRFITSAGGTTKGVSRHHVIVEFLGYDREAVSGAESPRKSALRMRRGTLKMDCDCKSWRYWYRYIATIGGFNAGRAERGYPKVTNAKLVGMGCKHIIRVMNEIERGAGTLNFLVKLMTKAKKSTERVNLNESQKSINKQVSNQARRTTGNDISKNHKNSKRLVNAVKGAKKPNRSRPNSNLTVAELGQSLGLTEQQIIDIVTNSRR